MNRGFFLLIWALSAASASAQTSLFDSLCAHGDTLVLELNTNWKYLLNHKKEKDFQPMEAVFRSGGDEWAFRGKVRTRGNIRLEICNNPSLKLKLKKKDLTAAGFSEVNKLKLVQQCSRGNVGLGYLRRERLCYELHQIYSSHFHRTLPVVIKRDGFPDVSAFLVEEEGQLAARYGRILEHRRTHARGLNRSAYVNLCLFNYLILNTDWFIVNRHNVEMVGDTTSGTVLPIPYDFDYSGFVGTAYSAPREELGIGSVYEPKWLGEDITAEELLAGARHYLAKAEEARSFIAEYPDLRANDRRRMLRRLDNFNELMANEKKLLRLLRAR